MIQNSIKICLLVVIMSCNLFAGDEVHLIKSLMRGIMIREFNILAFDYCLQYTKFTSNQQDKDTISLIMKNIETSSCGKNGLAEIQEFIDKRIHRDKGLDLWQCIPMLQDSRYQQKIQHIVDTNFECLISTRIHKKPK